MPDKSKMSVAEMLAAARKSDQQGDAPAAGAAADSDGTAAAATSEAAASESTAAPPAAKKPSSGGGPPSVAEMLAMARGGGSAAAPKPAPKPAAKPAAAKAAPKRESAAPSQSAPVDTQSILAAARSGVKPGPMTKAEAAAKGQTLPAKKTAAKETIVVPPMPVKPAYARPAAEQSGGEVAERRAFLFGLSALAIGFVAMGATIALWTLGSVRFMFPNVLRLPPSRFKVGFPDQFAPGQVEEKFKAQFGVWVVNTEYNGQQEIFALKSVCTHLGCTPNWLEAEQKFKCPCHGSGFYKDGINFEGPAPRPLERYAISVAGDGQIEVDKNRTFFEEKGDWIDPASYVPA